MLLIWTCKEDKTVDWFENRYLNKKGVAWNRFNTDQFLDTGSLTATISEIKNTDFNAESITSVWYRRQILPAFPDSVPEVREYMQGELEFALDVLRSSLQNVLWVNVPEANRLAARKLNQLKAASLLGFRIPRTVITNDVKEVIDLADSCDGYVIVKALRRGSLELDGSRKVFYSNLLDLNQIRTLEKSINLVPAIFQEPIRKDFELRVVVLKDECFAIKILSQERVSTVTDWRKEPLSLRHEIFQLPGNIAQKCVSIVKDSNLVYSSFDLIVTTEGEYVFLEHNPTGQFAWLEELTGIPIGQSLLNLLNP